MTRSIHAALAAIACAAVLAVTPAAAHEKGNHAAKHGGKTVESGHHHVEIVAKDGTLDVYVDGEDGKPEDVTGAKATAAVLSDGKKVDIVLASSPPNVFKGTGAFKAGKGTTIVVTITMPGHKPEQMRVKLD